MILSLDQKEFEMIRATAKYFIDLQDWQPQSDNSQPWHKIS